jgi:CheY-like chemotaxis protein
MLIFYVDDDSDDREMFADAIREIDPKIICHLFDDSESMLAFFDETVTLPDFAFVDINMPRINGYECAKAIRARKSLRNVEIVMFSTTFNPNDKKADSIRSKVQFLDKPSRFTDLVSALKKVLLK